MPGDRGINASARIRVVGGTTRAAAERLCRESTCQARRRRRKVSRSLASSLARPLPGDHSDREERLTVRCLVLFVVGSAQRSRGGRMYRVPGPDRSRRARACSRLRMSKESRVCRPIQINYRPAGVQAPGREFGDFSSGQSDRSSVPVVFRRRRASHAPRRRDGLSALGAHRSPLCAKLVVSQPATNK